MKNLVFISKIASTDRKKLISIVLLVSIIVKTLLFGVFNHYYDLNNGRKNKVGIFISGADTKSYFEPIENLVKGNGYSIDGYHSAFRMPGLLPIYGPLYALFSSSLASEFFVILQILADSISAWMIFMIMLGSFNFPLFYSLLGWTLYMISSNVSCYNHYGLTETFAAFSFTAFFFFLLKYLQESRNKFIFLSGLFITWFIFLKPVGVVFLPFLAIAALYSVLRKKKKIKQLLVSACIFILPFGIFESAWIIRNYITLKRFIPLTSVLYSTDANSSLKKLFRTTGLTFQAFSGNDHMTWFAPKNDPYFDPAFSESNPFPERIFTSACTIDSLRSLRNLFWQIRETNDTALKKLNSELFALKVEKYINAFKTEKKIDYYILVNAVFLKKFLLITNTYNLPFYGNSLLQKGLRAFYLLIYYLCICCLFMFSTIGIMNKKIRANKNLLLTIFIIWVFILTHVFMGVVENRYLVPVFPLITTFFGGLLCIFFYKENASAQKQEL